MRTGRQEQNPCRLFLMEVISLETWKDIPGYEGKYQASDMGRIRSLDQKVRGVCHFTGKEFYRNVKGRVLRPGQFCKSGHVSVILGRGTPGRPVHQLVMLTFVGAPPDGMEVLHNNGDPTDNRLENLRYGTRTENILDVYRQGKVWRKLSVDDVQTIRFGFYCGIKGCELSKMYGVSQSVISAIRKGRLYSWLK